MSEAAHKMVDEELDELEKRLAEYYSRAADELEKKAEAYFDRFQKRDAEKKKLVDDGKMTQEQYNAWRQGQMMTGQRWKDFRAQAARSLVDANKHAVDIMNGRLPEIYAMNFNEVGKEGEKFVKGIAFDLVNKDTVAYLAKKDQNLLPYKEIDGKKFARWNEKQITSEVMQGILQGESVDKLARRFREVTDMNRESSIRNARTTFTSAENKGTLDGMDRLSKMGLIVKKQWMATHDKRVRDSHLQCEADDPVDLDKTFSNGLMYPGDPDGRPEEVYNCRCTMTTVIVGYNNKGFDTEYGRRYYKEIQHEGYEEASEMFRSVDREYHAKVSNVVDMLEDELLKYDNTLKALEEHYLEENPRMRRSTAHRKALEALGERPTKVDLFRAADYDFDTHVMRINARSLHTEGGLSKDIEDRLARIKKNEERIAEGKRVRITYNVGDTKTATFLHEYGHAIDATYGVSKNPEFLEFYRSLSEDDIRYGLSDYATTDPQEFIAEAFCESFMGETQGDLSKRFMEILGRIVHG